MKDKIYTLYWRTGERELVRGRNPAEAMTLAGYSSGAVGALDFYSEGEDKDYTWDAATRQWKSAKVAAAIAQLAASGEKPKCDGEA